MKFSTALSMAMAPLALAKAVHNVYPVRRNAQSLQERRESRDKRSLRGVGMSGFGITDTTVTEVIIIWVNPGSGALTTTINQQLGGVNTIGVPGAVNTVSPVAAPAAPGVAAPVAAAPGAQTTHQVTVGGPTGLQFVPSDLKAAIGDMVIFTYLGNNHTATQSAFATPCDPLAGGMDSGFQANINSTLSPPPQVAMQVMVDTPLWFYCRQANHCGKGMTFSINPTADKTQAMFQALAIQQKGTGGGSVITGGQGAAAPAAAPPAAVPPPVGEVATATLALTPGETVAANPIGAGAAAPGGVAVGSGQLNPDGSCTCAVVCGAGSFPSVEIQGIGGFGGMPGTIPANMLP